MSRPSLAPVHTLGALLVVVGVLVLLNSTDFDVNPFLGDDDTNQIGQLSGVVVAAAGAVAIAIGMAASAVCRALAPAPPVQTPQQQP